MDEARLCIIMFCLCSSRTATKRSLFPVGRRQSLNMAAKLRQVPLLHFRLCGTYIAHSQSRKRIWLFYTGKIHQLVRNFVSTMFCNACCNYINFLQNEHERSFISCDTLKYVASSTEQHPYNSSSTHFMLARNQKGIRREITEVAFWISHF